MHMHLCGAKLLAETLKLTIRSTTLLQPVPVLNSNLARFLHKEQGLPGSHYFCKHPFPDL